MTRNPQLIGRWRIVDTEVWDQDALDLVKPAFIELRPDQTGDFGFIAVRGWLDCRYSMIDGRHSVDFSWEGKDEYDDANGRGWAVPQDDGTLTGHIYFHMGDDSSFLAEPFDEGNQP